jgi:amidase
MAATGAALSVCLIGGVLVLTFSGPSQQSVTALKPLQPQPSRAAAPVNPAPVTQPSPASEPYGGLGALAAPEAGPSAQTSAQASPQAPLLPVFAFPAPPQLPGIPTIDWAAAVQPFIQSQANSIAANLATIGIGTETDGSIICPSAICGLVGLKPTVGLVSRSGIIPISASQDTAGPMTRTVRDAALVLQAIAGRDPADSATANAPAAVPDYLSGLTPRALAGVRLGVARNLAGFHPRVDAAFEQALGALRAAGAVLVDPVSVPNVGKYDEAELTVLLYEFKDGLNRYLASRGSTVQYRTLAALMAYNREHAAREMPWFAQELFEQAEAKGPITDAAYREALATCQRLARTEGLDALFADQQLAAIVAPSNGPSWPTDLLSGDRFTGGNSSVAAVAGYPSLTVPMAFAQELPLGLTFIGTAWSEARLLAFGYAFEQATKVRRAPRFQRTIA